MLRKIITLIGIAWLIRRFTSRGADAQDDGEA